MQKNIIKNYLFSFYKIKTIFFIFVIFIIIPLLLILFFVFFSLIIHFIKIIYCKIYIFLYYYIFSLGILKIIKIFFFDFINNIYLWAQFRYKLSSSFFLSSKELPNDFIIYLHPKFSYFHINYGYLDDFPIINQGTSIIYIIPFFFNFITTSKLFNIFELDFFFLFSLAFIIVIIFTMTMLFLGLEYDLSSFEESDNNTIDDNIGETDDLYINFNDFDFFPKTLYNNVDIKNELYDSDIRHPEWLYFIKAFRHEYYAHAFFKESDQVFIYFFMLDVEDEFSYLRKGVSDDNDLRYDFFFFIRFNFIYPFLKILFSFLPNIFLDFFYNLRNPTLTFYSFFFNFFYFLFIFKEMFLLFFCSKIFFLLVGLFFLLFYFFRA
jgi:hypothetical protein